MHLISHLKTKAVIILTLFAISFSAYAQAPNLLNYQGVARNAVGNPLPNQTMNLRLSVHNLSAAGAVVYSETRVIKTNLGGLFSVQVGSAGTTSATGTIGGVNWLSGDKYLQVEIDPASNNSYLSLGTVQLVSVPYAFNAVTAANALTVTTNANLTGAVTSNGNLTSLAASPALTGVPTAPTAAPGTNTTQIATTEFVKAAALTGPTGAKGVQGLAGADGASGAPGPQGIPGLDGAIGAQGIQGLPGAAGAQGIQGIQGLTGSVADVAAISGTSTANGASITSGVLSLAPADATNGGIVTTGDQIFAGAKTFNADLIVNGLSVGTGAGNNNTNTAIGKDALKTNSTGRSNNANGEYSLYYNTTGNYNTANGGYSLFNNTTGEYNTANGVQALFANTEGSSNTANGKDALKANTTGSYNTANGLYALYFNKEGSFNTANGLQALFANKTGSFNTANGINAGYTNTTGDNNTFIGHGADVASGALTNATAIGNGAIVSADNTFQLGNVYVTDVKTSGTITAGVVTYPKTDGTAGQVLTANANGIPTWAATGGIPYTGANAAVNLGAYDLKVNDLTVGKGAGSVTTNSAIGHDALYSNTTGDFNTAIGRATLGSNTIGYMNTAIGTSALGSNKEGFFNTATGGGSLQLNTTGMNNTATGANALAKNTIGYNNTAQGASALYNNTTGLGNTAIGHAADVASGALTNATAIGNGAIVAADNTIQLGNGSVTDVKTSGTITAGVLTYPNTNGSNGQVLTANTNGAASWTTVSGGGGGGVTTVGSVSGSSNVKGATISGTTITLTPADDTNGGIVTTGVQTFTGAKTFSSTVTANVLGVGTNSPSASAQLEVSSTSRGFLPPRMTYAQKEAIVSRATGLMIYCTNCGGNGGEPQFFNGTAWVNMIGGTALTALPIVASTSAATSISSTSATSGGDITSDGGGAITARGVVWNTSTNPTIALSTKTTNGTGTGSFSSNLTGLTSSTTYYVKAYATNSSGTSYGNEITFATSVVITPEVTSATGLTWMDRNLGASRVATSSNDVQAYGDLYQWGRGADGHQLRGSLTTSTQSSLDKPGDGLFILNGGDWRTTNNDNLWQGVNGTNNNPCPSGFRIPTNQEWIIESASWSGINEAFSSPLKVTLAGDRRSNDGLGAIVVEGVWASFWTSTISGTSAYRVYFGSNKGTSNPFIRSWGFSVRCIKDY
jgi:uncharacterized protein (TIGR02145 family)